MPKRGMALALLLAGLLLAAACGGGGDQEGGPAASGSGTPGAGSRGLPTTTGRAIAPPLEGPARGPSATSRTNFRELSQFALPSPESLPEAPGNAEGAEFQPPEQPQCPQDWQQLQRPVEGFKVCYPQGWTIEGHGYVSAGVEDRWYSVGLYLFQDEVEKAHVSIYVVNPYARPFTYTRDCQQAYRVTFAGEPAVLCPDYPGARTDEVKIIAYHIRKDDLDYFVNVAPKFDYDPQSRKYLDSWSKDDEATAIQIAHSFQFIPRPPTPTP